MALRAALGLRDFIFPRHGRALSEPLSDVSSLHRTLSPPLRRRQDRGQAGRFSRRLALKLAETFRVNAGVRRVCLVRERVCARVCIEARACAVADGATQGWGTHAQINARTWANVPTNPRRHRLPGPQKPASLHPDPLCSKESPRDVASGHVPVQTLR